MNFKLRQYQIDFQNEIISKIKEKIETKKAKAKEEDVKEVKKASKPSKKSEDKKIDLKNLDEKLEDVLNIDNLL